MLQNRYDFRSHIISRKKRGKLFLKGLAKFIYKVEIIRNKYLKMLKNRYISTLLSISDTELQKGLNEIEHKYKNNIKFRDKLICLAL